MPDLPKLVAIIGPTASGKTALGEFLALRFNGEIVSADSKQIYTGMDIGTAKELSLQVPQHLISIREPGQTLSVWEYQQEAYRTIDDIRARERRPFLVGGSMLYAEAVTAGYVFSPDRHTKGTDREPRYRVLQIGIDIDREVLRKRIAARTRQWIGAGLIDEVAALRARGVPDRWLEWCGQEYKYFTRYLRGELSLEDAEALANISINQFVKRQYTWWRHHGATIWIKDEAEATRLVEAFFT